MHVALTTYIGIRMILRLSILQASFLGFSSLLWCISDGQNIEFSKLFQSINFAEPDSFGYRRCAYWQLMDGTHVHSECDPYNMQRCGQSAKFDYKCCAGYEEDQTAFMAYSKYRPAVCSKMVSPFNSCLETILQSPKYAAFAPVLASVRELKNANSQEAYTIFVPVFGNGQSPPLATEHIVRGRYYAKDLVDDMELETLEGRTKLHVSRFPYGPIAIDCAEILEADLECQNGVIHKIRQPVGLSDGNPDRRSIMSWLQSHPETSAFANDLPAEVKRELSDVQSGKRYTVFAPRAQAWDVLKLQYNVDNIREIAAKHVLKQQVCSGQLIRRRNREISIGGNLINIECEVDPLESNEKRYILSECGERSALVELDMTAANGVVHIIDKPVIPLSVMNLEELTNNAQCVSKLKIKEFVKLLKECDLYIQAENDYAIIAPQDEAFSWWSKYEQFAEEYKRFQTDQEYRCRVARYHIVKADKQLDNLGTFTSHTQGHRTNNKNDYLYETTYFKRSRQASTLNFHYSPVPEMRAHELDGISLYLTTRINVIPEKNITDILQERSDTKITYMKTMNASMDGKHFQQNAPRNLYLVTTDDGWKDPRAKPGSARPYRSEYTMYEGEALENFLLLHHVPLYLWGGDIGYFAPNTVHKFPSSVGIELTFWCDRDGVMRIGYEDMPRNEWPKVIKWNLPARDGIVWLLDGPLKCPDTVCRLLLKDIDYYDMYVAACMTAHLPGEPNAASEFHKKPTDVADRHPDLCTVILQLSESSVSLIDA